MPALETERLVLRALVPDDAAHLARLFAHDFETIKQTGRMPYPPTEAAMRAWIDRHVGPGAHGFLIVRKADGAVLGSVGFGAGDDEAELGYALGRPHWGQGYASEAVEAMLAFARDLGLRALDAYAFPDNPASVRVLEKTGFTDRGTVERDYPKRGGMRPVRHFRKELEGGT